MPSSVMRSGLNLAAFSIRGAWVQVAACLLFLPCWGRPVAAGESPDSYFDLSLEELAHVDVVTASLAPQSISELPASVSVITRRQIRESGARNLYDLLRSIPGVRVDLGNRGRPVISVRGVQTDSSNHLLFLLDGHVLNEPANGSAAFLYELTRMPLENVQRIEVLRGPGSPVFGANAFLGVVNVITRAPERIGGTELTLRSVFDAQGAVGQEFNYLSGAALSGGWAGSVNLNLMHWPGGSIGVDADAAGRSGTVDDTLAQFDVQARLESRTTRLSGRFSHQTSGEHYGVFYELAPDDESRFSGGFLELSDSRDLSPAVHLHNRLYADLYTGEARVSRFPRGSLEPGSPWFGLNATGAYAVLYQDLAKYGLETRITYRGIADHRITYGAMLEYQSQFNIRTLRNFIGTSGPYYPLVDVSDSENFSRDADRLIFAPFVEDLWKLTPELNLNLGLRLDHYSDTGTSINPRLGMNWQVHPGYHLHAQWGTAFRSPDFRSMYLDAGSFFGNPQLEEERISSMELGLRAQLDSRLSADVTLFHNRLEDLIALSEETARFENMSGLSTRGVELATHYECGAGGNLAVSYSFAEAYEGDQSASLTAPRHSGAIVAGTPLGGGLEMGMQLYWQSHSSSGDPDPLPGYLLLNARLGYRWSRDLGLEAAVYDLLDQDYAYPAPPGTYAGGLPAAGRSFMLGLKLEL